MPKAASDGRSTDLLEVVDRIAASHEGAPGALIPILQGVQNEIGFVPPEALERIGERAGVPASSVFGVATFYSQFRLEPVGRNVVKICHGTACHVQGALGITEAILDELGVREGQTTPDGKFTVESVACLGCCSLAPVIMIGEDAFGRLTPDEARRVVREYQE
jgi:NADH-quinone oxidoreductase subunit E